MLTPGEFVVRKEAVRQGNNLQILRAMNRGQSGVSNNEAAVGMANGGTVYARRGIFVRRQQSAVPSQSQNTFSIDPSLISKLSFSLDNFNKNLENNIERLNNTTFNIKLDTTNVNVNLNGGSFLGKLKEDLKNELLTEIGQQISSYGISDNGRLKKFDSVV
jgi:hypothetical protein